MKSIQVRFTLIRFDNFSATVGDQQTKLSNLMKSIQVRFALIRFDNFSATVGGQKVEQIVCFISNIRSKLFGTPSAAENLRCFRIYPAG